VNAPDKTIGNRTSELLQKSGDEIGILAVMLILRQRDYDALDTPEAQMIVDSIIRSTNELDENSDLDDVADYVNQMDIDSLPGFINNVKGIYHEMEYVDAENNDGDDIYATLQEDTNHPGSDIILTNRETGEVEEIQLKATDDPDLINHALEKYPDTEIYATTEVAGQFPDNPMVHDSGISNKEITAAVQDEVTDLKDVSAGPLDFIPKMALWSTALASSYVIRDWWRGNITREECIVRVAKITGLKTVKVAAILALLAFPPTSAPTSIYIVAKICYEVFKAYAK